MKLTSSPTPLYCPDLFCLPTYPFFVEDTANAPVERVYGQADKATILRSLSINMLQNTYKAKRSSPKKRRSLLPVGSSFMDKRLRIAVGLCLQGLSLFLGGAFVAHLLHGKTDQSVIEAARQLGVKVAGSEIHNWLGLVGALCGYYLMFRWLGITAFLLLPSVYLLGHRLVYGSNWMDFRLDQITLRAILSILWLNVALGYADILCPQAEILETLVGGVGFELGILFNSLLGWGTLILLLTSLLIFLVYFFNITTLPKLSISTKKNKPLGLPPIIAETGSYDDQEGDRGLQDIPLDRIQTVEIAAIPETTTPPLTEITPNFTVEHRQPEEFFSDHLENYDPKLDLSFYQHPTIKLLDEYGQTGISVTQEELAQNKNRIVETLTNFKIGISSIKATIGPTVTLYEIVPEAGIKISKIKNLEDDIALSLSALGIRIIAPIPGKGTIGIEVPNKNREIVPLRSILSTEKFMKSAMELPIVMGRTIANEAFMADLARMPHLLIAGATGQGKSVGLNVVLASLIYKKHPSQLKLVLVDPKKVELSLYNKLERHFLAKLPGNGEPIITETKEVIHTLNSLCLEMDQRYGLLKEAGVRNIKEYNERFVRRKLNPEKGHRFLPYIVLVIDEFADMMMTAGKEIETPIARLAQLARAIGIHLVLATQRPSVNVITGIIKANFPVRISYKVTSRIDSRTILDAGGAEQLVGRGDMLFSMNSEITRIQCPFLDTEEVERICDYVGSQRGYTSAYLLPDYEETQEDRSDIDLGEKDPMFEEAANLVVAHQQGSTSLIQRKLKLGYNRAGRLMDQLEAAGIVGPFEGSKARTVLVPDTYSLEQILQGIEGNISA
jgi:S-DNA-T family DNA segregation ATPase FtsK/SpoIIIE